MAGPEVAFFRGEGGVILAFDLPLPEAYREKVTKGYLVRVANAEGEPYVAPVPESTEGGSDLTNGVPPRPAQSASKAEWVGYAVLVHDVKPDDAEGMTKQDLIDKYGRDDS